MTTDKTALILAAFGTKHEQEEDFVAGMKATLEKRCPGVDVFIAFTSKIALENRLQRGQGGNALAQLLSELSGLGYAYVAVQSLHVAPGLEFDALKDITERFTGMPKGIRKTSVGYPLIYNDESAEKLANILAESLPKARKKDEAVLFVGHGSHTPSGTLAYPALQAFLYQNDPNLFVGTVEGMLTAKKILEMVKSKGIKTVWLCPLLTFCGTHVRRDIFGGENSWQKLFEENGITCALAEETLLARPGAVAMWQDNAALALFELSKNKKAE